MIAIKSSILIAASRWSGFGGMQYTNVSNPGDLTPIVFGIVQPIDPLKFMYIFSQCQGDTVRYFISTNRLSEF